MSSQHPGAPTGPEPLDDDRPVPLKRGATTQERLAAGRGPGFGTTALRTLLVLAAIAVLLVGIFAAASALEGDNEIDPAPWAATDAPDVTPDPLDAQ